MGGVYDEKECDGVECCKWLDRLVKVNNNSSGSTGTEMSRSHLEVKVRFWKDKLYPR